MESRGGSVKWVIKKGCISTESWMLEANISDREKKSVVPLPCPLFSFHPVPHVSAEAHRTPAQPRRSTLCDQPGPRCAWSSLSCQHWWVNCIDLWKVPQNGKPPACQFSILSFFLNYLLAFLLDLIEFLNRLLPYSYFLFVYSFPNHSVLLLLSDPRVSSYCYLGEWSDRKLVFSLLGHKPSTRLLYIHLFI